MLLCYLQIQDIFYIFNMEDQIRKICPIAYLNIWDDYPAPRYNQPLL